jgi:transcriptional regulator with XRE-family HTH domain
LSTAEIIFCKGGVMFLDMRRGRPSTQPRCGFGERLLKAREAAGLSQTELGDKVGVLQRTIAYWERRPSSLLPEQISKLAVALNVPAERLIYDRPPNDKAVRGPTGKVRSTIEQVEKLPKREQAKILDVVNALIAQAIAH